MKCPQVVVHHGMTHQAQVHVLALGMMTVRVRVAPLGLAQVLTVPQAGATVPLVQVLVQAGIDIILYRKKHE